MSIFNTIRNDDRARVRVQRRDDPSEYQTYGGVEYITAEVDIPNRMRYTVLHHDSGETSTFNWKEWSVLIEKFVELM